MNDRLNPDDLLSALETQSSALRIFLGMSAGVGKTYSMLKAAHQKKREGYDVVVGLVETHGRQETAALLEGLEVLPRKQIDYKGTRIEELDLDAILARRPQIVLVDELAHTNAPGSRHKKRYQDVLELLDRGIDVYTALNVQHLESRKEAVESITLIPIRETVPDSILDRANQVELVDIAPQELLRRLAEGKVYLGDRAERATQNFFKEVHLTALREIALRLTAERVDQDLQRFAKTSRDRSPWQTNERLMVAVSHSPYSERLIRATRRIAYSLDAPWIAIHIDNGASLSNEDQAQLTKNLALASDLKAEVITTTDTDIVEALKRTARQKNVTQVLVGRPTRRWLRDRIEGGSLLDRLVRESLEVDVHVVSQEGRTYVPPVSLRSRKVELLSQPIHYWNTFCFMAGVAFIAALLNPLIEYQSIGFLFLLGVLIVGTFGTLGTVVFSAFLSLLTWNFFFIPPTFTFFIRKPADVALAMTFFVAALVMGSFSRRLRSHEKIIREREERTSVLYEILKDMTAGSEQNRYLLQVCERIGRLLGADCDVVLSDEKGALVYDSVRRPIVVLDEKSRATAEWSFRANKTAGWSTETLGESRELFIPLQGGASNVGVFVFRPKVRLPLNGEQRQLLFSVARQLGLTLERSLIEMRLQDSRRLEESERLHQTLLNSISHEMRTPLTAILGAAHALEDEGAIRDPVYVKQAASQLLHSSERLNRVIGNLLDMSRLDSGVLQLKLEWEDAGDLIRTVIAKNAKVLSHHVLKIEIGADLPLLKIDAPLMEHAIANLLVNAAAYAPSHSQVTVRGRVVGDSLEVSVEDQGPGIPISERSKIFEKFYRIPGTAAGGTGLGLSIVKSIVETHGGRVSVDGETGARFKIELPLSKEKPEAPEV
jgi:two-component system sensor histidine kinase KdpD